MTPRGLRPLFTTVLLVLLAVASACTKQIGDSCSTGTECSINGDRACDLTQPSGYCTVIGCDPNSCPDNARCVEFIAGTERRARRFCVKSCRKDSDCRGEYRCQLPTTSSTEQGALEVVQAPQTCAPDAGGDCHVVLDTDGGVAERPGYCVPRP